jgi:hypothetical protein
MNHQSNVGYKHSLITYHFSPRDRGNPTHDESSRERGVQTFTFHLSLITKILRATQHTMNHQGNVGYKHSLVHFSPFTYHQKTLNHQRNARNPRVSTSFQNCPKLPLTCVFRTDNIHLVAKTRTPPSEWQQTSEMNRQPDNQGADFYPLCTFTTES